jgi:hypothetical protein
MVLRKLKFDRFVERGVVGQALARSSYDASSLIAMIVYYAVLLPVFTGNGPRPVGAPQGGAPKKVTR